MMKFYRCNICGNLIEMIHDSGAVPSCCGQPMEKLIPGASEGSGEKHIPVCTESLLMQTDNGLNNCAKELTVQVGEQPHPMTQVHSIRWITVLTDQGIYHKKLDSSQKAEAVFLLHKDETVKALYTYCNLHGLWVNVLD